MDLKNVDMYLKSLIFAENKEINTSKHCDISIQDSNRLLRLKKMIDEIDLVQKMRFRKSIEKSSNLQFLNKIISTNKLLSTFVHNFELAILNFRQKLDRFEEYLQQKFNISEVNIFDPHKFIQTIIPAIFPVKKVYMISRNVKFHAFNFPTSKNNLLQPQALFDLLEQFNPNQSQFLDFLIFDKNTEILVKHQIGTEVDDLQLGSINMFMNQTEKMTESTVYLILAFSKENEKYLTCFFENQKLKHFVRIFFETIFKTVYHHTEQSLTQSKLCSYGSILKKILYTHSFLIFQTDVASKPELNFVFIPKNVKFDTKNNLEANFIEPLKSFEFDIKYYQSKDIDIGESEKQEIALENDNTLRKHIIDLKNGLIVELYEKMKNGFLVFFEVNDAMSVIDLCLDPIDRAEFLDSNCAFQPNSHYEYYIKNEDLVENIEIKFNDLNERLDCPSFIKFLHQGYKIEIGWMSIMEGHFSTEGPRFYILIKRAKDNDKRIYF